jgi:hypothetical protein
MEFFKLFNSIFNKIGYNCLFGVSTLSNQRRDFISSRPIKLQKKGQFFFFKVQNLLRKCWLGQSAKSKIPYHLIILYIDNNHMEYLYNKFFFLKFKIFKKCYKFYKFQNFQKFHKISKFSSYFNILIFK